MQPDGAYRASVPDHHFFTDLSDPARLLRDLDREIPLVVGLSVLCQVSRPATEQRLVAQSVAWRGAGPADADQAQQAVTAGMRRLGHTEWTWDDEVRLSSAVTMVVVREGRAVERSSDFDVWRALRYANNPFQALVSDIVVVTPHGWFTAVSMVAGLQPVARPALKGVR